MATEMTTSRQTVAEISRLQAFADKLQLQIGFVIQKLALDFYSEVVEQTPVKTGRARASWNIGIGQPDDSIPPPGNYAPPAPPITDLSTIDGTREVFVTSTIPYMVRLEEGHSPKAERFVATAAARSQAQIDAVVGEQQFRLE
jgi:hypothetical protein